MTITASNKVVITGELPLTAAKLQAALNDLHAEGVPEWAKLEIQRGSEWVIFATWDPRESKREPKEAKPETPAPWDGIVRVNPGAGVTEEDALRVVQRRIRDNPQA